MEIKVNDNIMSKFYDDVISDGAKEVGKTMALLPRTINAALAPLRLWIEKREYRLEETIEGLAPKLENCNAEKIVSPDMYVAIPAVQAITYCMDNNELRNLYLNLLAKAMYTETKEWVHPAFIEIVKQMSPLDAKIVRWIYCRNEGNFSIPIGDLVAHNKKTNAYRILEKIYLGLKWLIMNFNQLQFKISIDWD